MKLAVSQNLPTIMHIDLNSCFATIEAQGNRLLRGRPIGVAAYDTPRGFVLAANYIAKAKGVKLGVNVAEAQKLCPGIVIITPDPSKYREAHRRFKELMLEYSPDVVPKSIDEFVINFTATPLLPAAEMAANNAYELVGAKMEAIGYEIKQKIAERLGEAVTVNVGIGPNRFLAKYAAGFNKPDGLTRIDATNLTKYYENMDLVDLPGINVRYKRRLWIMGITTPLQFYEADAEFLHKKVFRSIVGYHWHMRLRGHEPDNREFGTKSIGHQYALSQKTDDREELAKLLMKLCEKAGRRLRRGNYYATGIHLYLGFSSPWSQPNKKSSHDFTRVAAHDSLPASFEHMHKFPSWHRGMKLDARLYGTQDIYRAAKVLLQMAEIPAPVKVMSMHVFGLQPWAPEQVSIFDSTPEMAYGDLEFKPFSADKRLSDALDIINNRYGEFAVVPATMMKMDNKILDRIAFGGVREI